MAADNESSPFTTEGTVAQTRDLKLMVREDPVKAIRVFFAASIAIANNDTPDLDEEAEDKINGHELEECDGETIGGVTLRLVLADGGGEGGGEYVKRVYAFEIDGLAVSYVRQTGSYYSHDGVYWDDDFDVVTARQETITVYE